MRILFLDDDPNRHEFFRTATHYDTVDYVWTAADCISKLEDVGTYNSNIRAPDGTIILNNTINRPYDLVCLDHDLGGRQYVSDIESTGTEVAIYIAEKLPKEKFPKKIIIHSWNPKGAARMYEYIQKTGIPVVRKPFSV